MAKGGAKGKAQAKAVVNTKTKGASKGASKPKLTGKSESPAKAKPKVTVKSTTKAMSPGKSSTGQGNDDLAWSLALERATSCEEVIRLEEARKNGEAPPSLPSEMTTSEASSEMIAPDLAPDVTMPSPISHEKVLHMPTPAQKRKSAPEATEGVSTASMMQVDDPAADPEPADVVRQDLLSKNLGLIRAVISDKRYDFPGSQNCRKMLVDLAPLALRPAINDRHPVQDMVVDMLGEALNSAQQALVEKNDWRYVKVRECEVEVSNTKDTIASTESQIVEQAEMVLRLKIATEEAAGVIKKAKDEIEENSKALANVEGESLQWSEVRQECVAVMEGSYKILKEGSWGRDFAEQRKCVQEVCDFLKDLQSVKVPSSLLFVEGPSVLKLKPESRQGSALKILEEIDAVFKKHLAFIDAKIEAASAETTKCKDIAASVQEALLDAQSKSEASLAEFGNAKAKKQQLEESLVTLQSTLAAQEKAVKHEKKQAESGIGQEELEREYWLKEGIAAFRTMREQ